MSSETIFVGDIYEDCAYHPVLCTEADGDDIAGISLVDGSLRSCSIIHCGVLRLSLAEAIIIKNNGPSDKAKAHVEACVQAGQLKPSAIWWGRK